MLCALKSVCLRLSPVVSLCVWDWVLLGVVAFLGSQVVLSPVVSLVCGSGCWLVWQPSWPLKWSCSHCLRLSFIWERLLVRVVAFLASVVVVVVVVVVVLVEAVVVEEVGMPRSTPLMLHVRSHIVCPRANITFGTLHAANHILVAVVQVEEAVVEVAAAIVVAVVEVIAMVVIGIPRRCRMGRSRIRARRANGRAARKGADVIRQGTMA